MDETGRTDGEEDFGIRLEWPADPAGEPFDPRAITAAPPEKATEEPTEEAARPAREPVDMPTHWAGPVDISAFADRSEPGTGDVRALAAIAARVDVLAASTTTFRNMVSDQLNKYLSQTRELSAEAASRAELYRQAQERGIEQLGTHVAACRQGVQELSRAVEDLAQTVAAQFEDLTTRLAELTSEVTAIRRRTSLRPREASADQPAERARGGRRGTQPR